MKVEITNEFEKEVYLKYIEYMEIPDCDKAYDMFFRDMMKVYNKNNISYLLDVLYYPKDIQGFRDVAEENHLYIHTAITLLNEHLNQLKNV